MYARLKRLYKAGRLDKAGLQKAVNLGWITEDEFKEITGEAYQ